MSCYYHPDRDEAGQCSLCSRILCNECSFIQSDGSILCSRCAAMEAAKDASENIDTKTRERADKENSREEKKRRRKRVVLTVETAVILLCLAVIGIRMPKMIKGFENKKPLRIGTYETDTITDECINDLWKISKMLQKGQIPDNDRICPVSNKPYEVIRTNNDIIVRCRNTQVHGFGEIRVSKLNPVPEIVK